ncbi:unnamed protein product [Brugia timori]|uniref:AbrB/MazE/SpoVT family DNA-binding domain-containing protein n=1 Tax=Brugia timori TaxID=42155 RepID=A0A0R3QM28_9BILA|nr:unnamed protein product [Brugia timori]
MKKNDIGIKKGRLIKLSRSGGKCQLSLPVKIENFKYMIRKYTKIYVALCELFEL